MVRLVEGRYSAPGGAYAEGSGLAWVFKKSGESWFEDELLYEEYDRREKFRNFGWSVALENLSFSAQNFSASS